MAARSFNASLFVGKLHPDVDEQKLFETFSAAGFVPQSIKLCRDVVTATSLGTAYVNFGEREEAANALKTLNFQKVLEKPMHIQWSMRDPSQRRSCVGNLFIKNLEKSISDKELHDNFIKFGEILSSSVEYHVSGESKGFGFVQFENPDSATRAIEEMNGTMWKGKKLYVGEFISKRQRKKQFTTIHVSNFGEDFTMEQLMDVFKQFGRITSAEVKTDLHTGNGRGFGFVTYVTHEAAKKAIEQMDGKELNRSGQKCKCSPAETPQNRKESPDKRKCNLYVSKLEEEIDDEMLKDHFSGCGTVTSARVMRNQDGVSLQFGYVCFSTPDEASLAVRKLNRKPIITNLLHVALYQSKEERQYSPHQKRMQQEASNPVIGVQQQVLPAQPAVQGQPVPQEAKPSSATPQVVQVTTPTLQVTTPTLHYPLHPTPGGAYPGQIQNVPPGVTFLPGVDGRTCFAIVPISQQLYWQLQQQLPGQQLTPKFYQMDRKTSDVDDSSVCEMLPPSALPNLPASPIHYTTHVPQPHRLPNPSSQEQQFHYQSPYRYVPPAQMQQPYSLYRLPNQASQEQQLHYQSPYRYVPPAQMQQPYSPYQLPNQTFQFPNRFATPTQMQQCYQWTNQTSQEQQTHPHSSYDHPTTQMQQPTQLPNLKLHEPQPPSHPLTTSKFDSTAPKPGNLPERESSAVTATQATGRPDNTHLGKEDLECVTSYLLQLDNRAVYDLGIELGLRQKRLKDLKQSSDTVSFRDEVIAAWLSKADQVSRRGNPTWRTLARALSCERVGQNGIADRIKHEHQIE